jgi:hypothetical protein
VTVEKLSLRRSPRPAPTVTLAGVRWEMATVKLAALLLISIATALPARAQTTERPAEDPAIHNRCATVALTSETPMLPPRLIAPYLQQRDDFRASRLVLTETQGPADATVTLTRSGERDTRIEVVNRTTGKYASAISDWTDHPGMIALGIMNQLRLVCPGSIAAQPKYRPALKDCGTPVPALRTVSSIAACSQTSWMDNREINDALRSQGELKEPGIQLRPACSPAEAMLDITHNLERTVEWNWRLRSTQGATISSGRVIAFRSRDAASKIAEEVVREIRLARDQNAETAGHRTAQLSESVSPRTVRARMIPPDFSMPDTRVFLSVDEERVVARDINNRVLFDVPRERVLDARLHADWRRSLQLGDPTFLALQLQRNVTHVVGDGTAPDHSNTPPCHFEGPGWSTDFCGILALGEAAFYLGEAAFSTAELVVYLSVGTTLAQIPIRSEVLEIAWEDNGDVKTASLQVPWQGSGQLGRALRAVRSSGQRDACGRGDLLPRAPSGTDGHPDK